MPECRDDADILRRHVATFSPLACESEKAFLLHYPSQIFEQGVSNKALRHCAGRQTHGDYCNLQSYSCLEAASPRDRRTGDGRRRRKGPLAAAARSLLVGTEGIATAEDDDGGYSGTTSGRSQERSVFKADRPRGEREG